MGGWLVFLLLVKPYGVRDAKGQGVELSITLCMHGKRDLCWVQRGFAVSCFSCLLGLFEGDVSVSPEYILYLTMLVLVPFFANYPRNHNRRLNSQPIFV
ncbi:hypothetical protein ASPBRDRAFT_279468 [Aspergillus brasiliensis CBS 101740]|uniref:Uncharacterized protein n=1 Tax=Aspergillus brasiliensis (strain CBS 101740 / IMI 381727 / IBT 21946) TaxID=767769 RepID=A0A1L9UCT2_ASPBC|nr:hypothetical protein ASPBRDRAFT_279468 [Aspergillus brasiliensis CBS 101740]